MKYRGIGKDTNCMQAYAVVFLKFIGSNLLFKENTRLLRLLKTERVNSFKSIVVTDLQRKRTLVIKCFKLSESNSVKITQLHRLSMTNEQQVIANSNVSGSSPSVRREGCVES